MATVLTGFTGGPQLPDSYSGTTTAIRDQDGYRERDFGPFDRL